MTGLHHSGDAMKTRREKINDVLERGPSEDANIHTDYQ